VSGDKVLPQSRVKGTSKVMARPTSAPAAVAGRRNLGFPVSAIRTQFLSAPRAVLLGRSGPGVKHAKPDCFDFALLRPYQYRPFRTGQPEGKNHPASKA
jgi:hypothetical protein